ncbi:unnamed protein product [Cercopithifilaria johnstoni]|uniref:Uncharacterized protein n=1 Tax=Cercopithifilaria johnstoni TaxID=2874296 RepID=A0A8J2LQJ8_9BILA|nr:unnamed protein product [Cercopithifilaria johnstoni]
MGNGTDKRYKENAHKTSKKAIIDFSNLFKLKSSYDTAQAKSALVLLFMSQYLLPLSLTAQYHPLTTP